MTHSKFAFAALVAAAALAACGGSDCPADGLCPVGDAVNPFCPADPAAFMGPLPAECLKKPESNDVAARRGQS